MTKFTYMELNKIISSLQSFKASVIIKIGDEEQEFKKTKITDLLYFLFNIRRFNEEELNEEEEIVFSLVMNFHLLNGSIIIKKDNLVDALIMVKTMYRCLNYITAKRNQSAVDGYISTPDARRGYSEVY